MRLLPVLPLLFTLGCIADNKSKQESNPVTENHVHVPPPKLEVKKVDTDKLVEDTAARVSQNVKTDMAANQAQLSGHITGQIHKIEASLSELIKVEARMDNNLTVEMKAQLRAALKLMAEVNVHLQNQIVMYNKMEARIDAKIQGLSAQVDATVAGQAGVANKIEKTMSTLQQDIKSGRDTNMLPQQAVDVIKGSYQVLLWVVGTLALFLTIIAGWAYRNARRRADNMNALLMEALSSMEPHKANEISRKI